MTSCLTERSLLGIHTQEGSAQERMHLSLCADCTERYEQLIEDLDAIGQVLEAPPVAVCRPVPVRREVWVGAAIACAVLAVLVLDIAWLPRLLRPGAAAGPSSLATFADDVSDAVFATADADFIPLLAHEARYVDAALDVGWPCTRAEFLTGDCTDQLSVVAIDDE